MTCVLLVTLTVVLGHWASPSSAVPSRDTVPTAAAPLDSYWSDKLCFIEMYSNMAIHFDSEDHTDFRDKEHADNETHCAELCCGGYKTLAFDNLTDHLDAEDKKALAGNEYFCDAVMFAPSLGHLNCILLMCQIRNCTLQFQPEQNVSSIILSKMQHAHNIKTDREGKLVFDDVLVATIIVTVLIFIIVVIILSIFGRRISKRSQYTRTAVSDGLKKHQEVPGSSGVGRSASDGNRKNYDSCSQSTPTVDTQRMMI